MIWNPFKIETAKGGGTKCYQKENQKGENELYILGEKYPIRGHARKKFLQGNLGRLKYLTRAVIKMIAICDREAISQEKLVIPLRVLAEELDKLIEAEQDARPKETWQCLKKIIIPILEEDNAYRYRWQWLMERLAKRIEEIKLSKEDKYYFFGYKNFRHDIH